MPLMKKASGFAMVEVMVTVAIITIGISGMGLLLLRAIQGTQDSAQQSQAMWIVQDFVGRMRANPEGARGGFYVLAPENIDCTTPPNNLCAETYQGNAEVAASNCTVDPNAPTVNTMATFDNWISTCGLSTTIYDSPSDFVINPQLTSVCTATSTRASTYTKQPDCTQYQVTLTWQTKLNKESKTEEERTNQNEYSMIVEFN
ncbi:MAG: type IV pilus modification protein PilV [Gammaproteobacteria bacterium]|nr:type IV pilus modification protein PilV [Gammaproteobacteria bacterium]